MKIGYYVIITAFIFGLSNCAKTNKNTPNTPADSINSVIVSASVQNNTATVQETGKDTFIYDLRGRLISIVDHIYDKDASIGDYHDSVFYNFNYSGDDSVPSSMLSPSLFTRTATVSHKFTYDSQSRIIRDSSSEGCVNTFDYNSPYIYATRYHPTLKYGTTTYPEHFYTDTVVIGQDNINHILEYDYGGQTGAVGPSIVTDNPSIPYSTYRNPFYNSIISPSIGILMYFNAKGNGYIYDFYSKNLYSQYYYKSFPMWQTDSVGRVNEGTFTLAGHDFLMSFNYKN